MLHSTGKKTVQYLLIILLPALFILGYFPIGNNIDISYTALTSPANLAKFVSVINHEMVWVEGGKFNMGSNQLTNREKPEHEVEISAFLISKTMITVEQFSVFIAATRYVTTAEKDSGSFVFDGKNWGLHKGVNWECDESGHRQSVTGNSKPVLHVSWYDAEQFCKWISKVSGKKYRLPTEAEWEFAAKGGIKTKGYTYSGGNDVNQVSWNATNSGLKVHPVCEKKPNELGLYDMSGDAWQWCSDWYAENYYSQSPAKNPQGPENGTEKICRGGSYLSGSGLTGDSGTLDQLNPASRGKEFPYLSASDGSFRIVCSLRAN